MALPRTFRTCQSQWAHGSSRQCAECWRNHFESPCPKTTKKNDLLCKSFLYLSPTEDLQNGRHLVSFRSVILLPESLQNWLDYFYLFISNLFQQECCLCKELRTKPFSLTTSAPISGLRGKTHFFRHVQKRQRHSNCLRLCQGATLDCHLKVSLKHTVFICLLWNNCWSRTVLIEYVS